MNLLRYVRAVLWSFVGLGRRADMDELHRRANPLALVAVAIAIGVVFVVALIGLVQVALHVLS